MTLSIITVNLNNREGLQRTIDSVAGQTFADYEWIVIDGGSTDGSRELIEQYQDRFAYWCCEPDKGIYNAMNKGIAHARGEWLLFLNSGDWLYEDTTLEKVFAKEHEADILYGNVCIVKEDTLQNITYPDNFSFYWLMNSNFSHQATFVRINLLRNSPYNENYQIASDWEFFLKSALKGLCFKHINETIAYYDAYGISSTNTDKNEEERMTIKKEIVSPCILKDVDIIQKYYDLVADEQIPAIDTLRKKNKFFHQCVTMNLILMKTINRIFYRKTQNGD